MEDHSIKYYFDSRLQNWEKEFSNGFDKIERVIDTLPVIAKEASYSQLTEITNQIIEWERKLINYDSEHKTDIFHDFQDFKTKLLIKLDRIDVSTILKIETDRSKLYDRLEILTKNFHNKIHEGHSDCSHCVQVKEVTINL